MDSTRTGYPLDIFIFGPSRIGAGFVLSVYGPSTLEECVGFSQIRVDIGLIVVGLRNLSIGGIYTAQTVS